MADGDRQRLGCRTGHAMCHVACLSTAVQMSVAKHTQWPLAVVIAPNNFKGTLSAVEAGRAIARGWHCERPADTLELLPISDSGDGFGTVLEAIA